MEGVVMIREARKFFAAIGIGALTLLSSAVPLSATGGARSEVHRQANLPRLTAAWWQWSISIPTSQHPFNDPPPNDCTFAQSGEIWNLGGVFNTSGTATRNCTLPAETSLLVPALNVECSSVEPAPFLGESAAEQRACARSFKMTDLRVELDGRPIPLKYVVSPQFGFTAPADNILIGAEPASGTSVSAGWWALIEPSKGDHTLKFGGRFRDLPNFDVTIAMTYRLRVV
jgi:hypothetical protein